MALEMLLQINVQLHSCLATEDKIMNLQDYQVHTETIIVINRLSLIPWHVSSGLLLYIISPGYCILINKVGEIVLYHVDIIPRTPLNALHQANMILMLGVFNNLDSNNLVSTYVPSHHATAPPSSGSKFKT